MDLAGNSLKTARCVGALTAQPQTLSDRVSSSDRLDFYRFKVTQRSTFHASLSGLTANANLELTSRDGRSIVHSNQSRSNSEAFIQTLKPGVYYLKVNQRQGTTQYQLRLSTSKAALPIPSGDALPGDRWLYQLQNASIPAINNTSFNLLTIDYSRDGSEQERYTADDLRSLQSTGKNALAYLSIGEAEDYRYYFQRRWIADDPVTGLQQPVLGSAPDWLDRTNSNWEGNYKVQYWSQAWQTTTLNYLDRIIDAGFNGVYLDIIDGFEYWSDQSQLNAAGSQKQALSEPVAAQRMIQFVERIAYHARVMRGKTDFQIVPQNGESILAYDRAGRYIKTINGIGIEDLFYDAETPQPRAAIQDRLQWIDRVQANGKSVLSIDYVDDQTGRTGANEARINDFLNQAESRGYLPYVGLSDRALDTINEAP